MEMDEPRIIGMKIPSSVFVYSQQHKEFTVDASSLPSLFNPHKPVWDDKDVHGFIMVGEQSDAGMIFVLDKAEYDREDEIVEWCYKASPSYNKEFNLDYTVTATIIND